MRRFHIVVNEDNDRGLKVTGEIVSYIRERGLDITYESIIRVDDYGKELMSEARDAECILVLGGDGTFIQVAGKMAGSDIPLIGINLGTVGYLAEVEKDNIFPTIDRLIDGDFEIEERMMLEGKDMDGKETAPLYALNDIVIARHGTLRAINYEIYVNGKLLNTYNADGIIISTPTGSTGYNLSAGGPIVEPVADLILVNPICPHTLNTRAIVLSAEDEVSVKVIGGKFIHDPEADVSFDGGKNKHLRSNDTVTVRKASVKTRIIRLSKESFLDILGRKMRV
ncbi:MAG: NAD(+)/NADH kinase [Lachnospiraceae bacterium]|nr:NAD(+)/NADH kinase [Lachnospiraceae bacterium]